MDITNELLAAYAEDNVSNEERLAVRQYLAENPDMLEPVLMMLDEDYGIGTDTLPEACDCDFISRVDSLIEELDAEDTRILPMTAMAAEDSINSLCALRCEAQALRQFGFEVNDDELIEEAKANGWLQVEGTALHNIGRLSGSRGLSIAHRYDCSVADIQIALDKGKVVIAVVDKGELTGDWETKRQEDIEQGGSPNHAVIVSSMEGGSISIKDSSTPQQTDTYPLKQFEDAWADSFNYLIIISNDDDYEPHPIDLSDVEISDDLIELREAIAENAHEVWAANRKREGWTYGPVRDDAKKQHPDMLAYNRLPESEKVYDREMAINTIKLVKKLGYDILKRK